MALEHNLQNVQNIINTPKKKKKKKAQPNVMHYQEKKVKSTNRHRNTRDVKLEDYHSKK